MSKPDFDVGDLVVCVDDGPTRGGRVNSGKPSRLCLGRAYRVSELYAPAAFYHAEMHVTNRDWAVNLSGVTPPGNWPYNPRRFRKIDRADDSFIEMLAACKPKELTQ